ncbi:MAG TPA: threonine--tRNA ligase [Methanospirillum sp.]|uniref:threonine--tRNA ligase n=2 Tax=Methanospirillum sp. TaxID=45200 RepID=UPI002BDC8E02|nr:threonine--tRNA ligase [Methanospirillum sp.]HOJ95545.1 threonine--tRNA ligase [Methanospirillum sp.]
MRLLLIHSDFIEYEAKKKTKFAEEPCNPADRLDDALVAFCAVESPDADGIEDVISQTVAAISEMAGKVECNRVMVYPYAHLSSDLAAPDLAVTALKSIEDSLEKAGYEVKRAPFGWYKSFSLSCKGHPLSELSRSITPSEDAAKPEKKHIEHKFFVLTPEGTVHDVQEYLDDSPFAALIRKEIGTAVPVGGEPVHVDLMRSKEFVDYEPVSDVGHLRWLPRGKLVRDLLADYALSLVLDYGASPVETPVMYDLADKAIFEHADKFGERQYRFKSGNRNMMLRFAACFGMFTTMRSMHISPNHLPMKMYELSTYSFRHEQKGEVIGLKRLRAFTMPDMHSLCKDLENALTCFEEQLAIGWKTGRDFGTQLVAVFRCTEEFYKDYEAWIKKIVKESGVPILIETLSDRVHYWIAKIDLAAIDGQNRPIENPTVQIDVESSRRFGIKYHLADGTEVYPPILHCSPTGSVERVFCAILENTVHQKVAHLPTWLTPTQVRIIPVTDNHLAYAKDLAEKFTKARIRADVDDRDDSLNKKIRAAGMDWVSYVIVVGDSEMGSGNLTVTVRAESEPNKTHKITGTAEKLIERIHNETRGMPYRPLYTPQMLSLKPRYI